MPQRLRRLMVEMIDLKICPITVATATLTEGVNLPFDLIFLTSLKRRSWDPVKEEPIIAPLSNAEFRNLAGRAGRPGAARGIEGMTLVALPTRISSTAPGQRSIQEGQRKDWLADYSALTRALLEEEREADTTESPLALLLHRIQEQAKNLFGIAPAVFIDWLERTAPGKVSVNTGTGAIDQRSRLADAMDELDSVLLSALAESEKIDEVSMNAARAEAELSALWQRTFTVVAAAQEAWLEHAFIRRGVGIVEQLYPDATERRRLYHFGFTPVIGRRFEAVAQKIRSQIAGAQDYGKLDATKRIDIFEAIGALLENDRGFGFRVRHTQSDQALLSNWSDVLGWWMKEPGATEPAPDSLRSWQRFVADNLEFRMGVAIGAVIAEAWSEGADDGIATPTLADWKETTQLPWFGFWASELLRWGTHDPFVAFCLSQGIADTRFSAAANREAFEEWLFSQIEEPDGEDLIDPRYFQKWQRSLPKAEPVSLPKKSFPAKLTGTDGSRKRYAVVPVKNGDKTHWLDPAGYELAVSDDAFTGGIRRFRSDYELLIDGKRTKVHRTFRAR